MARSRDQNIQCALRLLEVGVSVEQHQWPCTFHGSQTFLSAEISPRQIAGLGAILRRGSSG
ncbi:alpha/beta hydrolase [Streptomyces sp. SID13031]|uniref:alpha/beta hydrolase n=1 Tax=Streptomyces sp. SID13031 TaxID=2706046 RepID=UPI0013CB3669|nr:alpha/beta hydrolase [Streptomyces sp. SID13031]NEA31293.1 alpha/beta hydrolase [Streptomyces sp. SID13031]